jgi:TonB family protein
LLRIELLVKEVAMSKAHLFLSLTATVGLLILAGGVGIWALPLRALAQAASAGSPSAEKEKSPLIFTSIQPITQVQPVYPREAKRAGIQGKVRLRVTINKDGSVMDIQVLSGDPQLVRAALEAVSQWRYSPNKVVRVTVVTVNFSLDKAGAGAPAQHVSREPPPLPKQSATDWVPFTAKKVERFYWPYANGEKTVHVRVHVTTELVARDSDGSLFTASADGLRGTLLDGRTGDSIEIDYVQEIATLRRSYSPAPLQLPTGEEYKHVPPERSLRTRMISGVECIGIKERASRGDERTTETWVAPSLNYEVIETTVLDPASKWLGSKKILSEVVLQDIQVGRRPDPRLLRIPEGFQKLYIGPL